MEFRQLIEYYKRNIFFQNHAENEFRRLVPDLFLFFEIALYRVNASGVQLGFTIFQ